MFLEITRLVKKRFTKIDEIPEIIASQVKQHSDISGKLRFEIRDNTIIVSLHSWKAPREELQVYMDYALEYASYPINVPQTVSMFWAYFVYTSQDDNLYAVQQTTVLGNSFIIWDMSTNSQYTNRVFNSVELALEYLG